MVEADWTAGFRSQLVERHTTQLDVIGQVPDWLSADLVRNGPSLFEAGSTRLNHWFDGFAKLHKFSIGGGAIHYSSRFIKSKAYTDAVASHKLASHEFASSASMSLAERLAAMVSPVFTDNTNVNVANLSGHCLALTETPSVVEFSLADLSVVGKFRFDDNLCGHITTAHPQVDPDNGCMFNLLTNVSLRSKYRFTAVAANSCRRSAVCAVDVWHPGYIHSFAMTERYLILMEPPLLLQPLELATNASPYIETYRWRPEKPTRFLIVDKSQQRLASIVETNSCFFFHHVNAYEDADRIILDAAVYDDAAIVDQLRLANLLSGNRRLRNASFSRFILNPQTKSVNMEKVSQCNLELPRINDRYNGKPYSFAYGCSQTSEHSFLDELTKIDLKQRSTKTWRRSATFPGEPVFVPRPGGQAEDDGVLLSVVLDTKAETSFLLILDAQSMQERARAMLPDLVPFGFHGQLFAQTREALNV